MILIVAEQRDGQLRPITRELVAMGLGMGRELEMPVVVLIAGTDVDEMAETLASWQVDRVIGVSAETLGSRSPDLQAAVVAALIEKESPSFVLAGHTSEGIEFIPRLAVRLKRSLVAGCVGYERHGDRLLLLRPIFNSKLHMRVAPRGEAPWFVTLAPGSIPADELETGPGVAPEALDVDLSDVAVRRRSIGLEDAEKGEVNLESAPVVVAVGRGIQKAENIPVVQQLADALDAPLGASRPVVDSGWLPRDRQIGSSGQTVSPRLYIAVGISGAIQHLVGMQSSQCIVAINKDLEAPVFKVAHYGIAGDLFEVVPEITRLVRELKGANAAGD
jgi:electron transfer flavoprotein alpha subunit